MSQDQIESARAQLDAQLYARLPGLMSAESVAIMAQYCRLIRMQAGSFQLDREGRALNRYAEPMAEALMLQLQARIEAASGRRLLPSYAFLRIYQTGAVLKRHRDRPSCEISVTLTIDPAPGIDWPIGIEGPDGDRLVSLGAGDGMLYKGCEAAHWRDALPSGPWTQVFLHYVDANGPNRHHRYDRRPMPGQHRSRPKRQAPRTG